MKKQNKKSKKDPKYSYDRPLGVVDINQEKDKWTKRLLIFTPTTGNVRIEWVQARYGQIIPPNWSFVEITQFLNPFVPVSYQLADAENLMAKTAVEGGYEWVLSVEHDNVLPPDAFLKFNQYMNEGKVPVISGVYFLRSNITEPLVYRGRGTSYFKDWKFGDKVWCDGVPFGAHLMHISVLKALWDESEEYMVGSIKTRRVFKHPDAQWYDTQAGKYATKGGTTDLQFCTDLIEKKIFEKAGWPEFQKMKNPFLVDTNIFVKHIDPDGTMYPLHIPDQFIPPKGYKGKDVK